MLVNRGRADTGLGDTGFRERQALPETRRGIGAILPKAMCPTQPRMGGVPCQFFSCFGATDLGTSYFLATVFGGFDGAILANAGRSSFIVCVTFA